jgi:hypothetical protein
MVKFSDANAKIEALSQVAELAESYLTGKRKVYSFDLLSGWSCPFANECLSRAVVQIDGKRKIKDGPNTKFRCFSASQEVQYNNVYNLRESNFTELRNMSQDDIFAALSNALPSDAGIVRIHVAGDFFNQAYMMAWCLIAKANPDKLFYAYTKSLRYWLELKNNHKIPDNLVFTASRGGREDFLIELHNLREAIVVYSEEQAAELGLEIDHDDSHAARPSLRNKSFALLIHGTQPKDSEAAKALQVLKKNNVKHSYSRKSVKV